MQEAKSFHVGEDLIKEVKKSPNRLLDYVAICGDVNAMESPIESTYAPKMQSVIQRVTLHEHKVEWHRTSRQGYVYFSYHENNFVNFARYFMQPIKILFHLGTIQHGQLIGWLTVCRFL